MAGKRAAAAISGGLLPDVQPKKKKKAKRTKRKAKKAAKTVPRSPSSSTTSSSSSSSSSSGSSSDDDEFTQLGLSGKDLEQARMLSRRHDAAHKDPARQALLQSKLLKLLTRAAAKQAAQGAASRPATGDAPPPRFTFTLPAASSGGVRKAADQEPTAEELQRRTLRQQRFEALGGGNEAPESKQVLQDVGGLGTCEAIEKEYLRLTSLPCASDVRPPHVLRVALDMVQQRWKRDRDYKYVCEQLKSIRQDLTVQNVQDELAVRAYETHARIALEVSDLPEFNQCYTKLKTMYQDGIPGNAEELLAYGLLYGVVASGVKGATTARLALVTELRGLVARPLPSRPVAPLRTAAGKETGSAIGTREASKETTMTRRNTGTQGKSVLTKAGKKTAVGSRLALGTRRLLRSPCVAHALAVIRTFKAADWEAFMRLYSTASRLAKYLMDHLLLPMREHALSALVVAHRPMPLAAAMLQAALWFETPAEALEFATSQGCCLTVDMQVDTRSSAASMRGAIQGPANPL